MQRQFSKDAINELKHYVYLYLHPDTKEVFYIGRGKGNRLFQHLTEVSDSPKSRMIQLILRSGKEPIIELLVYGLKDIETAKKVEAAAIDLIGIENLTNQMRGDDSSTYGRISVDEFIEKREAVPVNVIDPTVLIRINGLYRYGMTPHELYEATRGLWSLSPDKTVKYAMNVYDGIIKEVYEIKAWFPAGSTFFEREHDGPIDPERWEFVGRIAEETIRSKYVGKSVAHYFKQHARNPIRYPHRMSVSSNG